MKYKVRTAITIITMLLFPIIMNFLSPYVPINAAMDGIIAGSLMVFAVMFVTGMFFGRAWCGWVCPMSALGDICEKANGKTVNVKKLRVIRMIIFAVWIGALVMGFIIAGGIKGADFLYLTESGVSVDMPMKYIIYYFVLAIYVAVNILVGKRGACHSFCWMSPFLAGGYLAGKLIKLPQLRIKAKTENCVGCGKCSKVCPMSIDVKSALVKGSIETSDCILCGECIKNCPKAVLSFGVRTATKIKVKEAAAPRIDF